MSQLVTPQLIWLSLRSLGTLLLVVGLPGCSSNAKDDNTSSVTFNEQDPMTIAASCVGRFQNGYSWYLSMNSASECIVTIKTSPKWTTLKLTIDAKQLEELKIALVKYGFFSTDDRFGTPTPDAAVTTITVVIGNESKCVVIDYLGGEETSNPIGAIEIHQILRRWIDDHQAIDYRPIFENRIRENSWR